MDIYLLKIIILVFVLKFNILSVNSGILGHEGNCLLSKFDFNVPYKVLDSRKRTNRNFKGVNSLDKHSEYSKNIKHSLKELAFATNLRTSPKMLPRLCQNDHVAGIPDNNYFFSYTDESPDFSSNSNGNTGISGSLNSCGRKMKLFMSRKVTYGYRYNAERVRRKGTVRSKIYFDMWKDKNPYYLIHKFLYENDPDNANFNYDIDLAKKVKCRRNIFAHYKKDNRLRFFWYASRKNTAKGPCSRYINYALDKNEFRFSKLYSYFHILPYVHEHYKDDPRYIYFMNRFLSRHGRVAAFKRMNAPDGGSGEAAMGANDKRLDGDVSASSIGGADYDPRTSSIGGADYDANPVSDVSGEDSGSVSDGSVRDGSASDGSGSRPIKYRRTISWKDMLLKAKEEEEELYKRKATEPVVVDLGNGRSFTVKRDGFKVYGEYYSKIDKKNRKSPYDIYSPFLRTKHSSRRRRYRQKVPLDPSLRCKTRRERILKNAQSRDVRKFIQKYLKQKPKSS